jgi:hypothetical protein
MNCDLLSTKPVLSGTRQDVEAEAGTAPNAQDLVSVSARPGEYLMRWRALAVRRGA